jgi:hypothetical protein
LQIRTTEPFEFFSLATEHAEGTENSLEIGDFGVFGGQENRRADRQWTAFPAGN